MPLIDYKTAKFLKSLRREALLMALMEAGSDADRYLVKSAYPEISAEWETRKNGFDGYVSQEEWHKVEYMPVLDQRAVEMNDQQLLDRLALLGFVDATPDDLAELSPFNRRFIADWVDSTVLQVKLGAQMRYPIVIPGELAAFRIR
jgi:hypothetical protein